jgi:hypothetical protein
MPPVFSPSSTSGADQGIDIPMASCVSAPDSVEAMPKSDSTGWP